MEHKEYRPVAIAHKRRDLGYDLTAIVTSTVCGTCPRCLASASVRNRRVSLIPMRPDEGRLTEPTTAIQPWRREPLFVPPSGRCSPPVQMSQESAGSCHS